MEICRPNLVDGDEEETRRRCEYGVPKLFKENMCDTKKATFTSSCFQSNEIRSKRRDCVVFR